MKTIVMSAICAVILLVGCKKKETVSTLAETAAKQVPIRAVTECGQEIILAKPIKLKGSDILLPVATRICIAADASEISVVLPKDFSFSVDGIAARTLPVGIPIATYHCLCSGGGACSVMFEDGLGFGCFHSNCTGGCTGQFTYKGYSVNRVVNLGEEKEKFFADREIQEQVASQYVSTSDKSSRQELYGVPYYFELPGKASCDCEGTKACKLKTLGIAMDKAVSFKIYYCDGPCNGCELTVN